MKCPFTRLPIFCGKEDCEGCEIRVASAARANQEIAENMEDYWKCQRSGAE